MSGAHGGRRTLHLLRFGWPLAAVLAAAATAGDPAAGGPASGDPAGRWLETCRSAERGAGSSADESTGYDCRQVRGTGVHFFTTAIVHSSESTSTGRVQRSTEIIELSGDLTGRVLYHPVSVFDSVAGTLVNTGQQVFSGTVLGSEPVLLYDDTFRFEVNLDTGETTGVVNLLRPLGGGGVQCRLEVVGTGRTAAGDATVDYSGLCRIEREGRQRPPG